MLNTACSREESVMSEIEPMNADSLPGDPLERAKALHRMTPLIDGHNDLPWQYRKEVNRDVWAMDIRELQPHLQPDLPRLREG